MVGKPGDFEQSPGRKMFILSKFYQIFFAGACCRNKRDSVPHQKADQKSDKNLHGELRLLSKVETRESSSHSQPDPSPARTCCRRPPSTTRSIAWDGHPRVVSASVPSPSRRTFVCQQYDKKHTTPYSIETPVINPFEFLLPMIVFPYDWNPIGILEATSSFFKQNFEMRIYSSSMICLQQFNCWFCPPCSICHFSPLSLSVVFF